MTGTCFPVFICAAIGRWVHVREVLGVQTTDIMAFSSAVTYRNAPQKRLHDRIPKNFTLEGVGNIAILIFSDGVFLVHIRYNSNIIFNFKL